MCNEELGETPPSGLADLVKGRTIVFQLVAVLVVRIAGVTSLHAERTCHRNEFHGVEYRQYSVIRFVANSWQRAQTKETDEHVHLKTDARK